LLALFCAVLLALFCAVLLALFCTVLLARHFFWRLAYVSLCAMGIGIAVPGCHGNVLVHLVHVHDPSAIDEGCFTAPGNIGSLHCSW
jgi:hypothetical protein